METAVFSATSLFHADDDSDDDDGWRGKVIPDPPCPLAPPPTPPPLMCSYLTASSLRLPFLRFKTRHRWAPRGRATSRR
jgi:hypothetical protein